MTGYETFGIYESLKLHFSKDTYDFFKYNGKTNHSVQSFENRKDKYHFYKLSRKYTNKDALIDFLVANFLEDDKTWVGKLLEEDADIRYRNRQKVIQSREDSRTTSSVLYDDVTPLHLGACTCCTV